jgi:2-polyprenyl-6-methoxyphenol hydroxylase-like FAD-dependent oxidoreductase
LLASLLNGWIDVRIISCLSLSLSLSLSPQAFDNYSGHGSQETIEAIVSGSCGTIDLTMDYPAHLMAPEWHHPAGSSVLIGDAAHAWSHNAAQVYAGQSLAAGLGDATALAGALEGVQPAGVEAAVAAWSAARSEEVSVEQAAALKVTRESQQTSGGLRSWLQAATMTAVGSVGSLGYPALMRRALLAL